MEIERNIEKLKEITGGEKIYTNPQMVETNTEMSDTLNSVKQMMKAVGFQNGSVIRQHTLRFVITAVIAVILASVIVLPMSKALLKFTFAQIGSVSSTGIAFDAVEQWVRSVGGTEGGLGESESDESFFLVFCAT